MAADREKYSTIKDRVECTPLQFKHDWMSFNQMM